jgi:hypothetical protein
MFSVINSQTVKVMNPLTKKNKNGASVKPALKLSFLVKTAYLIIQYSTTEMAPLMAGASPKPAKMAPRPLPLFQPHCGACGPARAMPIPEMAATSE